MQQYAGVRWPLAASSERRSTALEAGDIVALIAGLPNRSTLATPSATPRDDPSRLRRSRCGAAHAHDDVQGERLARSAGKEGDKYVTSRNIRERLMFKEAGKQRGPEGHRGAENEGRVYVVSGRGLNFIWAILIENDAPRGVSNYRDMASPKVIMHGRTKQTGDIQEPIEYLVVDVAEKNIRAASCRRWLATARANMVRDAA